MQTREMIVTFHGLGDPPPGTTQSEHKVWVPVDWFEAVLDALPPSGVAIAFDDGNASDVVHALPALSRRGQVARFFVLAGAFGRPGRLTEADVLRLDAAGMRVGSHGLHHRDWRRVSDAELARELKTSRTVLTDLIGSEVAETACPFGSYDRRVLRAARQAGYRRFYTSDGGTRSTTGWLAPRTTITQDRPLEHWLNLVTGGPSRRPNPLLLLKRYVKRVR